MTEQAQTFTEAIQSGEIQPTVDSDGNKTYVWHPPGRPDKPFSMTVKQVSPEEAARLAARNKIQVKRDSILEDLDRAWERLKELQESCPHENVTRVGKSNTGNYDPSTDSYWYDCECQDCGKKWMEDQ